MPSLKTSAPVNPEAYGDYLKGRYFYNKLTEDDLHKSVAYFEAALSQDRGCALAYAGLADAYSMFALLNMLPFPVRASASQMPKRYRVLAHPSASRPDERRWAG